MGLYYSLHMVHQCQLFKDPKIPKQPIGMVDREGLPFSRISADISGPYVKSSKGNTQVFVVLCMVTKYVLLFALKKAPAHVLANILCEQVFAKYGIAKTFLSDNGPSFIAKIMLQVCEILAVHKKFSLIYQPSTNGQAERVMRSLNISLFMTARDKPKTWCQYIPFIASGINQTPHKALGGLTPFTCLHGYDFPKITDDLLEGRIKIKTRYPNQTQNLSRELLIDLTL